MWRARVGLLWALAGCNALFGIHDIAVDAGTDPCTGVCECHVDTDCADSHAVCIDAITSRTCECAAGYGSATTGACTWQGVVVDPDFLNASAWTGSDGALVDPNGSGDGDFGVAVVAPAANGDCNELLPAVVQTITMPRLSRAQPLVMELTYRNSNTPQGDPLTVAVGDIWSVGVFARSPDWTTTRVCLGPQAYAPEATTGSGAPRALEAAADTTTAPCKNRGEMDETQELEVDHLDIVPANPGECPDPGTALNGSADGSGGWTFGVTQATAGDGGSAGFGSGDGQDNSTGVVLVDREVCDQADASVPVSIPVADATGAPALSIYHVVDGVLSLSLGGQTLPLSGGGVPTVDRYCVPAPLVGGVFELAAALNTGAVSGTCTDASFASAVLDNVTVANDPQCTGDPGVTDAGFESGTAIIGGYASGGGSVASVVDAHAHGGARDLQMSVSMACAEAQFAASVIPPPATTGAGPALAFYYEVSPGTSSLEFDSYHTTFAPIRDGTWHQGIACLDPNLGSRPQRTGFVIDAATVDNACTAAIPTETFLIDDLSTTTSTMCPTM